MNFPLKNFPPVRIPAAKLLVVNFSELTSPVNVGNCLKSNSSTPEKDPKFIELKRNINVF